MKEHLKLLNTYIKILGQRASAREKVFALHAANQGLIPGITYSLMVLSTEQE